MGHARFFAFILSLFALTAQAAEPLDLALRDTNMWHRQTMHFASPDASVSVADTYCTSIAHTFWLSSQHPGYGHRVNQSNHGVGFKCRLGDHHPLFIGIDTLENSQWGVTWAGSLGKQFDLPSIPLPLRTELYPYIGASLTALSYEIPHRNKTYYGVAPMAHRGVALRLPYQLGVIGWEEQRLPVDRIRLRSVYIRIDKKF